MSTSDSERVAALFYGGADARARTVAARIEPDGAGGWRLVVADARDAAATAADPWPERDWDLAGVQIGDRVGGVPRLLTLPGGATLEIVDNAAFDAQLATTSAARTDRRIGKLERAWGWALAGVVTIVVATAGGLFFGGPALARVVATHLPVSFDERIGGGALVLLDERVFGPSSLPRARQGSLTRSFERITAGLPRAASYRLTFRDGGAMGANALALPNGTVVITDQLVVASANDDEIRAVLAHEVGHLEQRHSMRMLLQSSFAAVMTSVLLGDASGSSGLVIALPSMLIVNGYSRDFEREADAFAFDWMRRNGIDPARLGDLLKRLERDSGGRGGGYFATHPSADERANAATAPR